MRKTVTIEMTAENGRDHYWPDSQNVKRFLLTEMPATQGEWWAIRAFLALAKGGVEIPEEVKKAGMAGLVYFFSSIGLFLINSMGKVSPQDAKPLLDEMFACIRVLPNPNNLDFSRPLVEVDIEEIETRLKLRREILRLHMDFSKLAANLMTSAPATGEVTPNT